MAHGFGEVGPYLVLLPGFALGSNPKGPKWLKHLPSEGVLGLFWGVFDPFSGGTWTLRVRYGLGLGVAKVLVMFLSIFRAFSGDVNSATWALRQDSSGAKPPSLHIFWDLDNKQPVL